MRKTRKKQVEPTPKATAKPAAAKTAARRGVARCGSAGAQVKLKVVRPAGRKKSVSPQLAFAFRIAGKFTRPVGAGSVNFLRLLPCNRLKVAEGRGLSSGLIFRRPAEAVFDLHQRWQAQLALTLCFNQRQDFYSSPNPAPNAGMVSIIERPPAQRAATVTQSFIVNEHPGTLPLVIKAQRESEQQARIVEKTTRVYSSRMKTRKTKTIATRAVISKAILRPEPEPPAPLPGVPLNRRLYQQGDESLLRTEAAHFVLLRHHDQGADQRQATKSYEAGIKEPAIVLTKVFSPVVQAETFLAQPAAAHRLRAGFNPYEMAAVAEANAAAALAKSFSPAVRAETVGTPPAAGRLRAGFNHSAAVDAPAAMLNGKLVEMALPEAMEAGESRSPGNRREPALPRKERQPVDASLNYVFAAPPRPAIAEEQAIKRIEEKEVVEIVRREVQTRMTPGSVMQSFSRADYTRIADQVYSNLVRRLMAERERAGLR